MASVSRTGRLLSPEFKHAVARFMRWRRRTPKLRNGPLLGLPVAGRTARTVIYAHAHIRWNSSFTLCNSLLRRSLTRDRGWLPTLWVFTVTLLVCFSDRKVGSFVNVLKTRNGLQRDIPWLKDLSQSYW